MGRSITEGLYKKPLSRNGSDKAISDKEVSKLDDDEVLYIRGEAPEGYYNWFQKALFKRGYEDHQIFKKLPTPEAPKEEAAVEEPIADKVVPEPEKEPEIKTSSEYADAKARATQWEEDASSGRKGQKLFEKAADSTNFLDRYKMQLGERLENGLK